jgi:tetratricopeptide (TPR) repeat protein
MRKIDEIKTKFKSGYQAEAIRECEVLCRLDPKNIEPKKLSALMHGLMGNFKASSSALKEVLRLNSNDGDALFNLGVSEREQKNFKEAEYYYLLYTGKFPANWDGWNNLAECQFQSGNFDESLRSVSAALKLNPGATQALITEGDCLRALKRHDEAIESYKKANAIEPSATLFVNQALLLIELNRPQESIALFSSALNLDPDNLSAHSNRARALQILGRIDEAIIDYREALRIKPDDEAILRDIAVCLVNSNRGREAIDLYQRAFEIQPSMLSAKLGIEWVLSKSVSTWHLPMMNEWERNNAYYLGLKSAVTSNKLVLEIGAGSGLLSMMAARLGAKGVIACESLSLIAETAQKIVEQNKLQHIIKVLPKTSFSVELGKDLPEKADILVHEIFSSNLLSENVLPAIEDAKNRLLKPDARILPAAASIMIALVGGDAIGKYLHVGDSCGFDLGLFNAICPKMVPFYREDLQPDLLSDATEAFRFDFLNKSHFPSETKAIRISSNREGLCYGVIQWIRLEIENGIAFENHPLVNKQVSNWQLMVHRFDNPIYLKNKSVVTVLAAHNRSFTWFDLMKHELFSS